MGDENFVKLYVCLYYRWNIYSEEVRNLPIHFWYVTFHMIKTLPVMRWQEALEPQAELIGQLTHPEIFKEYKKIKNQIDSQTKSGSPINTTIQTDKHITAFASTTVKYDPKKGLIDQNGNIVVSKEKYDKTMKLDDGLVISF